MAAARSAACLLRFRGVPTRPLPRMRSSNFVNGTWSLDRGATVLPDGSVRFSVWAPNAQRVAVRVLTGPSTGEHELTKVGEIGVYEGVVRDVAPGADYKLVVTASGE